MKANRTNHTSHANANSSNKYQFILNTVFVAAILFLFAYVFFFRSEKLAYVDSSKIMADYKGAVKARKEYDGKIRTWQSNIDTLTYEVQNGMKKYEKDLAHMSIKEAELSKQLINSKRKQLSDYQRAIQENAQQEETKLYKDIVTEINAYLLDYGKSHDYKIILIANQSGTIAYAREGLDITQNVLDGLNSSK